MSRCGYDEGGEDGDNPIMYLWESIVRRGIEGKRGQKAVREMIEALDAMPVKCLVADSFDSTAGVCMLGALAKHRGVSTAQLESAALDAQDDYMLEERIRRVASKALDIAPSMAAEVMWANDLRADETPEFRWVRMRGWAERQLKR